MMKKRNNKFYLVVLFSCSAALLLSLCKPAPRPIRIDETFSGGSLELTGGDTLIVTLKSNPSTGYLWKVVTMDTSLMQNLEHVYIPKKVRRGIVGSGGTDVFLFEARRAGNTSLKLIYHRPWEKETAPAEEFNILLKIR